MSEYYVYVCFRVDGSPCYVGKGTRGRWHHHLKNSHNTRLNSIVARGGGEIPIAKVRENLSHEDACSTEIALIKAIGRFAHGGPLVNMTDGGDGTVGHKMSAETRAKMSIKARTRVHPKTGPRPPEVGAKISAAKRGVPKSDAFKQKISEYMRGRPKTEEQKAAMSAARKRFWERKKQDKAFMEAFAARNAVQLAEARKNIRRA